MKVKTNVLSNEALNYAATLADKGTASVLMDHANVFHTIFSNEENGYIVFTNYLSWSDAGPVSKREKIDICYNHVDDTITATKWLARQNQQTATCPIVAAMRCFVESHLGSEVEIPDVLCNSYD